MTIDFEEHRAHLRGVAYRMLGSQAEAEDAVQEAWLRLARAAPAEVENPRGWLTTVVGRICLDMLRTRTSRREDPIEGRAERPGDGDAEAERMRADAVGQALCARDVRRSAMLSCASLPVQPRSTCYLCPGLGLPAHDSFVATPAAPCDLTAPPPRCVACRPPAPTFMLMTRTRTGASPGARVQAEGTSS